MACGVVAILPFLAITPYKFRSAERRMHENSHSLRVYADLFNAIMELNLAGDDPFKKDIAKKSFAPTLHRPSTVSTLLVAPVC